MNKKGFTLLEILLVVGIIAILAGIVIVAINPGRQLAQTRNVQRASDLNAIYKGIYQYYIENGAWPDGDDTWPADLTDICDTGNDVTNGCISLDDLVPDFITDLPTNPQGGNYQLALSSDGKRIYLIAPGSKEYGLGGVAIGTSTDAISEEEEVSY